MRNELIQLIRATPFVPFDVHMSSGATYTVMHPELVALASAALYVVQGDETHRCSLLHITGVSVKEPVQ